MKLKNKIKAFIIDKFWLTTSIFLAFGVFFFVFVYFFLFDLSFQKRMVNEFFYTIMSVGIFFIALVSYFVSVIMSNDDDDDDIVDDFNF